MRIFLFSTILFACSAVWAQPGPPPPPPDPDRVPISGIELLLVGGGVYGVYRARASRKKKE